ncbi:hypothetical protein KI387_032945, partial [Taxus chinensis]
MIKEIPGCVKENTSCLAFQGGPGYQQYSNFRMCQRKSYYQDPTETPCPMDDLRLLESCLAGNHPREVAKNVIQFYAHGKIGKQGLITIKSRHWSQGPTFGHQ